MQLLMCKEKEEYILSKDRLYSHCGGNSTEDPPVPISNTEVKLCNAENTCRETGRENM